DVSDVHAEAPKRVADRRFRRPERDQEALQKTQAPQARANAKAGQGMGALSQHRLLVFVEEHGREDDVANAVPQQNSGVISTTAAFQAERGSHSYYSFQFPL